MCRCYNEHSADADAARPVEQRAETGPSRHCSLQATSPEGLQRRQSGHRTHSQHTYPAQKGAVYLSSFVASVITYS